jgi:hypothetical protein
MILVTGKKKHVPFMQWALTGYVALKSKYSAFCEYPLAFLVNSKTCFIPSHFAGISPCGGNAIWKNFGVGKICEKSLFFHARRAYHPAYRSNEHALQFTHVFSNGIVTCVRECIPFQTEIVVFEPACVESPPHQLQSLDEARFTALVRLKNLIQFIGSVLRGMLHLILEHLEVATNASLAYGDLAAAKANIASVELAEEWIRDASVIGDILARKIAETPTNPEEERAIYLLKSMAAFLFDEWKNRYEPDIRPEYTNGDIVSHSKIPFPWNILLFTSPHLLFAARDANFPRVCQFATTRFANCLNVMAGKQEFFIPEEYSPAVGPDHEYLREPFVEKEIVESAKAVGDAFEKKNADVTDAAAVNSSSSKKPSRQALLRAGRDKTTSSREMLTSPVYVSSPPPASRTV